VQPAAPACTLLPVTSRTEPGCAAAPTFVDLFAGCGGLALGFKTEGFRAVGAVEFDADAAETYRRNIDEDIHQQDIAEVASWPTARVVVGGPPCQGFSQLGTRDPDDERNRLWRHYVRVLDATDADVFVMENVPQLLRSAQFELLMDAAAKRGFRVQAQVLNAAEYGVPQTRRRAIVMGSRLGEPLWPKRTHGALSPDRRPFVAVRSAFDRPRRLPSEPDGKNWHVGRPGIRAASLVRYRAVPASGGSRFDMQRTLDEQGLGHLVPACWRNKTTGTTDVFGRMWWDRPAPTIRTEFYKPEKGRYLHPEANRPITVREAARLQSFPDDFVFPASQRMTSVARQIGNAVPPLLAAALARAVKAHLLSHAGEESADVETVGRQLALV
jgi:DNA (cytosine-5)-methyltransferase 1